MSATLRTFFRPVLLLVAATAALAALAVTVPVLSAAPGGRETASAATISARVLAVARSRKGSPYQWGATGPHRFDCSGYTDWVFRHVGVRLPRTAAEQWHAVRHIAASARRPGDLVFFFSGRSVYHVGIYAGANSLWHAPHTGARVHRERLWTSRVRYGRAR